MHLPVNRWTVGLAAVLLAFFGSDFLSPIMKAVAVLTAPYVPAL